MKRIYLLAMVVVAALLLVNPAFAEVTQTLYMGQTTPVGTVTVTNSGFDLTITYHTNAPYLLVETHLAVGPGLEDSTLVNNAGNPKVGLFPYGGPVTPYSDTAVYNITVTSFPVQIAAHAVVINTDAATPGQVVSDTSFMVTRSRAGDDPTPFAECIADSPAFRADEPLNYRSCPLFATDALQSGNDDSTTPSVWDNRITGSGKAELQASGADWIWESAQVLDPVAGTVIRLEKNFNIDGYPLSGTLLIAADNGFQAYVNQISVQVSSTVSGDWKNSDLYQAFVTQDGWEPIYNPAVGDWLQKGNNNLTIDAVNEHFNSDDSPNPCEGYPQNNPGGVIFLLKYCSAQGQTAWGNGTSFPGSSWAMYFVYPTGP
jgi:hypothetical protein